MFAPFAARHVSAVLLAGLCLALAVGDAAAQPPPAGVTYEKDVQYGQAGDVPLLLDLARPEKTAGPVPCIVVIHGGAWRGGMRQGHATLIQELARRGYVAATISYRLVPKHRFPAQVEDAKCAVRFLRASAEKYGIDPKRIGAMGFSAGAHLSMLLGAMGPDDGLEGNGGHAGQSSQVQAVVAYFGPTDFTRPLPPTSQGLVNDFVGSEDPQAPARKAASPVTYVSQGDAPLLIFQGTKDPLVPHEQAVVMVEALTKAQVPGRVELLIGAGHGWQGDELKRTLEATAAFFEQRLGPAATGP